MPHLSSSRPSTTTRFHNRGSNIIDTFYAGSKKNNPVTGGLGINANEQAWLEQQLNRLDNGITGVVSQYAADGAIAVDMRPVFAGHEWCTADPWVFGPSVGAYQGINKAPFHPTIEGSEAMAQAIANALNGLTSIDADGTVMYNANGTTVTSESVNTSGYGSADISGAVTSSNQSLLSGAPFAGQNVLQISSSASVSGFEISTPASSDITAILPRFSKIPVDVDSFPRPLRTEC